MRNVLSIFITVWALVGHGIAKTSSISCPTLPILGNPIGIFSEHLREIFFDLNPANGLSQIRFIKNALLGGNMALYFELSSPGRPKRFVGFLAAIDSHTEDVSILKSIQSDTFHDLTRFFGDKETKATASANCIYLKELFYISIFNNNFITPLFQQNAGILINKELFGLLQSTLQGYELKRTHTKGGSGGGKHTGIRQVKIGHTKHKGSESGSGESHKTKVQNSRPVVGSILDVVRSRSKKNQPSTSGHSTHNKHAMQESGETPKGGFSSKHNKNLAGSKETKSSFGSIANALANEGDQSFGRDEQRYSGSLTPYRPKSSGESGSSGLGSTADSSSAFGSSNGRSDEDFIDHPTPARAPTPAPTLAPVVNINTSKNETKVETPAPIVTLSKIRPTEWSVSHPHYYTRDSVSHNQATRRLKDRHNKRNGGRGFTKRSKNA
jgi:hypothetical protein